MRMFLDERWTFLQSRETSELLLKQVALLFSFIYLNRRGLFAKTMKRTSKDMKSFVVSFIRNNNDGDKTLHVGTYITFLEV